MVDNNFKLNMAATEEYHLTNDVLNMNTFYKDNYKEEDRKLINALFKAGDKDNHIIVRELLKSLNK